MSGKSRPSWLDALEWAVSAASVVAMLWGLAQLWTGAQRLQVVGLRLSSRHPWLLLAGGLAGVLYTWVRRTTVDRQVRALAMPTRRQASWMAAALALATAVVAFHFASAVAGGSDSYGYVSQAALWRAGRLIDNPEIVYQSPWPLAINTWSPLAYRPSNGVIVPVYPPGLPLMMALMQLVTGYCGALYVAPLCAAAMVFLTFRLGIAMFGRPAASLWAALLMATSPVFLYMAVQPMSDVPATAVWTLVLILLATGRPLAAGLAIGLALAIRPNLLPVAAGMVLWTAAVDWQRRQDSRMPANTTRLAIGAAPAIVGIAWLNTHLYGSPIEAGYGTVESFFSPSYWWTNVAQFTRWTFETERAIVAASLVVFAVPRWFPLSRVPLARLLLGAMAGGVLASYLFYRPFDGWWYLRFLLPMWPVLMVLTALALEAIVDRRPSIPMRLGAVALLCVVAAWRVHIATERHAFELWRNERRFVDVARYVADHTDSRAVVITWQHSGSIRHYGGRLTLRWDLLDEEWLDRTVAFLASTGRHPYIVLDGGEVESFRTRFGRASTLGSLEWRPSAALRQPSVFVYDALDRHRPITDVIPTTADGPSQWRCDAPRTSSRSPSE